MYVCVRKFPARGSSWPGAHESRLERQNRGAKSVQHVCYP